MPGGIPIRDLFVQIGLDVDEKALTDFDNRLVTTKRNMRSLGKFLFAGAASIGVFLNEAGKFEQVQVAFETMLGNAAKAKKLLGELDDFARTTPFQIPGIQDAAKRLLAFGFTAEEIIPTMENLGNIAAGVGKDRLPGLILALGQVRAATKLRGQEIRQFTEAGVPLLEELANVLNVSEKEVFDLTSRGEVSFDNVQEALRNLSTGTGRFTDLMIKQSKTMFGIMSNTLDFLIIQARAIGKELLPEAKKLAVEFLSFVEANRELIKTRAVKFFKEIGKAVIIIIKAFGFVLTAIFDITEAFGGLEKVVKTLVALFFAMVSFNLISLIGSATQAVWAMVTAVRTLGVASALANASFLLIPAAIGLAVIALGLILEDIFSFFTGKDSIVGVIIDAFEKKFPRAFKVAKAAIDLVLAPIKVLFSLIGKIKDGLQSLAKGGKLFELGSGKSPATIAANIAKQSAGIEGSSPATAPSSGSINNKSNVISLVNNSPITINSPVGSSTEDIAIAVREEIDKSNNTMLRDAQKDTISNQDF